MEPVLHLYDFEAIEKTLVMTSPEIGEEDCPSTALLFRNGSITTIPGQSSYLTSIGFIPYENSHFNTQFALTITKALATLHGLLRAKNMKNIQEDKKGSSRNGMKKVEEPHKVFYQGEYSSLTLKSYLKEEPLSTVDAWTSQISRSTVVSANLQIMVSLFQQENASTRLINKLESIIKDIETFSRFIRFSSAMQKCARLQSVGPISMCDVWVLNSLHEEEEHNDTGLVIRLRGGPDLQAPPLRDVTWIWLTLLRPAILQERYTELCETYCNAFNNTLKIHRPFESEKELTLFDIMSDLGDNFLHAFLTVVHKFTVSGVWCLDRQLHTSEGIQTIAESLEFLIDHGIIGSLFIL